MNRVKREYCSRGRHPNWRAWDGSFGREAYCLYCKADIAEADRAWPLRQGFWDAPGSGNRRALKRRAIFRGLAHSIPTDPLPERSSAGRARSLYNLKKIGYWKKSIFLQF